VGDAAFSAPSHSVDERARAAVREHGVTRRGKVIGGGVRESSTRRRGGSRRPAPALKLKRELPMHIGLHAGYVVSEG
jgi:hypothetical protein